MKTLKKIIWIRDSLKNLKEFPEEVQDSVGYSLYKVQEGLIPRNAKQLKGLKPTVMEIVSDFNTDTYRTIYTVKIKEKIYVLHCFQKKAKKGIKTSKQEVTLIKQRLRDAKTISKTKR